MKIKTSIVVAAVASLALSACGDGIRGSELPSIVLQDSEDRGFDLPERNSPTQQGSEVAIQIQNSGEAPLTIETLELSGPDVLVYDGGPVDQNGGPVTCSYDGQSTPTNSTGECTDGQVCKQIPKECHTTKLPETPFEMAPGHEEQFNFFLIADGTNVVDCPEPGPDVPDGYRGDYCGELRLETNASTDNGTFSAGDTTLYFQYDPSTSGEIQVEPSQLRFSDVRPGATVERELTVLNSDSENRLEIQNFDIEGGAADYLSYSPRNLPQTIDAGEDRSWTFALTIPSELSQEEIPDNATIYIESSASNVNTSAKAVLVDILGTGPVFQVDKKSMSFQTDGTPKTLTVTNTGTDTLQLDSIAFEPVQIGESFNNEDYDVVYRDDPQNIGEIDNSGQYPISNGSAIEPGESADFEISYTGAAQSEVGWMVIHHNDPVTSGRSPSSSPQSGTSRVLLMGGRDDEGFAQLVPNAIDFETFAPNGEVRRPFVVRSLGAQPLIGSLNWNMPVPLELSIDTGEDDPFPQEPGTLAPGEIEFLGTNSEASDEPECGGIICQTVSFEGNIPPVAQDAARMSVDVSEQVSGAMAPEVQITPLFSGSSVEAGEVALLSAEDSTLNGDSDDAIYEWFVLDRPTDGTFFAQRSSGDADQFAVRPDAAGTWRIALIISNGELRSHKVYDLTVTDGGQ